MKGTRSRLKVAIGAVIVAVLVAFISYIALGGLDFLGIVGEDKKPFTVRLETDKLSYTSGEVVKIRIYLINHTNETMKFEGSATAGYTVYDSSGQSIYEETTYYTLGQEPIIVAPQGEILFPFTPLGVLEWKQVAISFDGPNSVKTIVGSGNYTIRAGFHSGPVGDNSAVSVNIKG